MASKQMPNVAAYLYGQVLLWRVRLIFPVAPVGDFLATQGVPVSQRSRQGVTNYAGGQNCRRCTKKVEQETIGIEDTLELIGMLSLVPAVARALIPPSRMSYEMIVPWMKPTNRSRYAPDCSSCCAYITARSLQESTHHSERRDPHMAITTCTVAWKILQRADPLRPKSSSESIHRNGDAKSRNTMQ